MHSTVYVIDDLDHTRYDEDAIFSGLPADCDYTKEVPLSEIREDDIRSMFGNIEPVITRNVDQDLFDVQFDVTIKTEKVREYLLAVTLYTKRLLDRFASSLIGKDGKSVSFYRAANALRDPYGLRIMDESQDDLHTWLTEKLAEADREEEELISFTIVQAFEYRY